MRSSSESWQSIRLKYLVKRNPSKIEVRGISPETLVSFLPMEAIGEGGGLRLETERPLGDVYDGYSYVADGDVLIAKITPCFENGKAATAVGLTNGIGFATTEVHVLRPGALIGQRFLFYVVASHFFRDPGSGQMLGAGGQKRVPDDFVANFVVPLPPLPEQRAIAAFLDRETERIDTLIQKKERLLELLDEKRSALIGHAVTRGLDPDVPMKDSGVEWIGEIPEGWGVVRLKAIAELRSGEAITSESIHEAGAYAVYGGGGRRGYTDRYTHAGTFPLIGRQGALCGNITLATGRFWASEHAVVAAPRADASPRWLAYLLSAMDLNSYSVSAAQPGLAVSRIMPARIPRPPTRTQHRIADHLDRETAKIDALKDRVSEAVERLKEYRTSLISAAVTGKIDVHDMEGAA